MLSQLRSRRNMKIIMWFVAITFIVGFVFLSDMNVGQWGSLSPGVAAVINGTELPYEVYSRRVTQIAEIERARFQRQELLSQDYDRIEAQAWDGIVSEMLLGQEARRLGIQVADEEIIAILETNPPEFVRQRFTNTSGEFDVAAYRSALDDPSYNWTLDEQYLRTILPPLKLQQMVRAGATVTEVEARKEFDRRNRRTKVQYAGIRWTTVELEETAPTEDELRVFYETYPERFRKREMVTLEVIRVDKNPSPADEADAVADAHEILDEMQGGETFAALAEIYSDDASATRGGDLGWTRAQNMAEPLQEVMTKLAAGQTSEPIRADRGLFLLHADSVRVVDDEREVRLRQILLVVKPSTETMDSLRTFLFELGEKAKQDFEGAAQDRGLVVERLDPIERVGFLPGIGFSKRLVDWAFEAKPGSVSEPIGNETTMLVARLVQKHEPTPAPLEEIRERVQYLFEEDRKKKKARERLAQAQERLRSGGTFEQAVRSAGLEIQDPAPFTYYESVPDIGSANEFSAVACALEPGQTSGLVETSSGAYLMRVVSRDSLDEAAYTNERTSIYQSLLTRRETQVYEAWLKELRDRADIEDRRPPRV